MQQVTKLYWASFLKNQTYFTPILILFLQFHHLDYQQVFWVFTIGSIVSFLIEVPTGVIADLFGKKKSIVLAKLLIFVSFVSFGFSSTFWMFVLSQVVYEVGQAFRSGTETAYAYDYLEQTPGSPTYTEVKGKQKFYARVGESIATALGGFLASVFGFNAVFFFAAIPAFVNFVMNITWASIKEQKHTLTFHSSFTHTLNALKQFRSFSLTRLTLNIMIFTSVLAALNKFIQPYMTSVGIPVSLIGMVYAGALGITAIAVRYSYLIENRFGKQKTINWLTLGAVIPVAVIGFGLKSYVGVFLFFVVVLIENIRSPIANSAFHKMVKSVDRATMGSLLALSKSVGKIALLPVAGYFADVYSLSVSVLLLGVVLLLNGLVLRLSVVDSRKSHIL